MNNILVLPYWCDKEIRNYIQVLDRWDDLCRTDVNYSFLVARRFDAPEDSEIVAACEKHAPTKSLVCTRYQWEGWPGGANGMFKHVMEFVNETEEKDGGFVFWFEHDVIPIHEDWLTWLSKMWNSELSMMGQYMSPPWINLHQVPMRPNINGTACYAKSLAENGAFKAITKNECFDFTLSDLVVHHGGKVLPLPLLYDLWFFMPDWVKRCDLNKLMINGIKDIDQREKVIKYIIENRDR